MVAGSGRADYRLQLVELDLALLSCLRYRRSRATLCLNVVVIETVIAATSVAVSEMHSNGLCEVKLM